MGSQVCASFSGECPIGRNAASTVCKDYPCSFNDCCEGGDGAGTCFKFNATKCNNGLVPKISKKCTDSPCSIYDCCDGEERPSACSEFPCSGGKVKDAATESCLSGKCTEKQCCDADCNLFTKHELTTCKFSLPKLPPPTCSALETQTCSSGHCCEKENFASCELLHETIGCPGELPLAEFAEDCTEGCTTTKCCKPDVCLNIQEACPIGFKRPDTYVCPETPCTAEQCCVVNTAKALTCQAIQNDQDCVDEETRDSTWVKDLTQTGLCGTMKECRIQCCKPTSDSGKKGAAGEEDNNNALLIALIVAALVLLLCCLCIPLAYKQYKKNQTEFAEDAMHGVSKPVEMPANSDSKKAARKMESPRARPVPRGSADNVSTTSTSLNRALRESASPASEQ